MAEKSKRLREEELRKKIQDELHQNFTQKQDGQEAEPESKIVPESTAQTMEYEEALLRLYLEEEICYKYPEFIKCENHLNEVRWLTPVELENEYEFYPAQEKVFQRFKKKFSAKAKPPRLSQQELMDRADKIRKEIEEDVKNRLDHFHEQETLALKKASTDIEKKIYQEEIDKFYSRKKGYKKYINHLNETKWMSKEEQKTQDEFMDEVITPGQIWRRRIITTSGLVLVLLVAWFTWELNSSSGASKAYLSVSTEGTKGHLYVDQILAAGFSLDEIYTLEPGPHEISFISEGYTSTPASHTINIQEHDTARIVFKLEKNQYGDIGLIQIKVPFTDAGIFVNSVFKGTVETSGKMILPEGDYTIMLEKAGYIVTPPQQTFTLNTGDTLNLAFKMSRRRTSSRSQKSAASTASGLLEIRSNIKNADIFLDGQKTNFKTDYVLQGIPLGTHSVRVSKAGYKVYPDEKVVKLTHNKTTAIDFTLSSTVRRVTLRTEPIAGDIVIDGKQVGTGEAQISLPLGEHTISFGAVTNYDTPDITMIKIDEQSESTIVFNYTLNYSLTFKPGLDLQNSDLGSVTTGYMLNDNQFRQSSKTGPEVRQNEKVKEKVWMLGFAFQFRNPPGQDAMIINFFVPKNMDLSLPLNLKLWAYQSNDLYPLMMRAGSNFSIDVNQKKFRKNILPSFSENEIAPGNYQNFQINELLRPGYNQIMLYTTTSTSSHLMLWKVKIE